MTDKAKTDQSSELDEILEWWLENGNTNAADHNKRLKEAKSAIQNIIAKEVEKARVKLPDDIKGVMVSGVKTLHHEMDTISIQDLRLLIAQLDKES